MKLKDLPRALGFGVAPREYGVEMTAFELPSDGRVELARWLHPGERPKQITQAAVDVLRQFIRPGDVAIDIGAHTGDSTVPMALAAGLEGRVYALEPNPYVFAVLAANAQLNPTTTRIVPLMFAATTDDGEFEFEYSDEGYCNGGRHEGVSRWRHGHFAKLRVQGRNLLRYLREHAPDDLPRVRYIKVDTEGADREVVRTLAPLIAETRPYLRVEFYRHLSPADRRGFLGDLRQLGYQVFKYEESGEAGEPLDDANVVRWPHFDAFGAPALGTPR